RTRWRGRIRQPPRAVGLRSGTGPDRRKPRRGGRRTLGPPRVKALPQSSASVRGQEQRDLARGRTCTDGTLWLQPPQALHRRGAFALPLKALPTGAWAISCPFAPAKISDQRCVARPRGVAEHTRATVCCFCCARVAKETLARLPRFARKRHDLM